ncbi:hypothetical protein AB3662_45525 [Sorangium cellulosum]|uniref:hypothetical protein n=1 Tax=Sorangium cellulosum TaxID=56 RepID=UPI003D9A7587
MRSRWPLDVVALNPASCGTVLWRAGGVLRVTVLVKATFAFGADGDAALRAPEPIEREDRHLDEDPCPRARRSADYPAGARIPSAARGCARADRGGVLQHRYRRRPG